MIHGWGPAHTRRKFFELHEAGSPIATEAVQRIGELYEIEATIRGRPPDERLRVRQQQSLPLAEVLQAWLDLQLSRLPGRSRLAEAIRYALGRWSALTRFLDDGRIDLTPTRSSVRSARLLSGARTAFSPAARAAPTDGQSSLP